MAQSIVIDDNGVKDSVGQSNPLPIRIKDGVTGNDLDIGGSTKYDTRFEDGATYMYVAEALPGSLDSDAAWRIKRYVQATLQGNWADGEATFTKVWDDRATYTY